MIKYLSKSKVEGERVVLRLDLNEPLMPSGKYVADDYRIQKSLPTIRYLQRLGKTIIILAHLGRPDGVPDPKFSLLPVAKKLATLLEFQLVETKFDLPSTVRKHLLFYTGNLADSLHQENLKKLKPGSIVICENIRFYEAEEDNSPVFGKHLAMLGDAFVNDAFSVSHHAASSICSITEYIPKYAGLQLEAEIEGLNIVLNKHRKPFVVLMGGAKISEKTKVLNTLGKIADTMILGGIVANEILQVQGYEMQMGSSEEEAKKAASDLWRNFKEKVELPVDFVVSGSETPLHPRVVKIGEVKSGERALDVGPESILKFTKILQNAGTIVWNGPLGWFEKKPFDTATMALASVVGGLGKRVAYVVVGGGETVDAIRNSGQADHIDLLSTGGGAMLSFLAGESLPGISALEE